MSIESIANWIAITTFLLFLIGVVFKGFQNLAYAKKSRSDFFIAIDSDEAATLLRNPLVLDISENAPSYAQNYHIRFSERIFDLQAFSAIDDKELFESCIVSKYSKQDIEYDTSIIDVDESLVWSTEICEFYSMGKLRWKTATGMKGEFIPAMAAGKERKKAINVVYRHTFKSGIYHFFLR